MFFDGWAIAFVLMLALWPVVLLVLARFGRRFSLRKMLLAVAVVSAVLGLIVFLKR